MNHLGEPLRSIVSMLPLLGVAAAIVWFALWARGQRRGVGEFYRKHSLCSAAYAPQNVRAAIGIENPMCLKGALNPISGGEVPFYWWEWSSSSMISTGTTVQGTISCFLAISFPPNTVSEEFVQIAIRAKETKRNILKKLKDIYVLNTSRPTRIEKLADGSFIIFWRVVQRPKVMESKIAWLKKYLSVPNQTSAAN